MNSAGFRRELPRRPAGCCSDFSLERWRQDELAGDERDAVAYHLGRCPACQDRLNQLQGEQPPAIDFVRLLSGETSRPARTRRWRRPWTLGLGAALAAGVAALFVLPTVDDRGERSKGVSAWELRVVARTSGGRTMHITPEQALRPGDRLRFEVSGPEAAYVSIVSIDSRGAVTPFLPTAGQARRYAGGRTLFEDAVALDGALGPEKLVLVACRDPIAVDAVVAAGRTALAQAGGRLQDAGALGLPCAEASFWLRKVAP